MTTITDRRSDPAEPRGDFNARCFLELARVQLLCARLSPEPEPWSGTIGTFPVCPKPAEYVTLLRSTLPANTGPDGGWNDSYIGLCEFHTAEMRRKIPAEHIISVAQYRPEESECPST